MEIDFNMWDNFVTHTTKYDSCFPHMMCTSIRFCLLIRTFPFEIFLWVRYLFFYFFTLIHFIFQLRLNPNESQRNITRQRILSLIRKKIGELELTKGTLQTNRAVAKKGNKTKNDVKTNMSTKYGTKQ